MAKGDVFAGCPGHATSDWWEMDILVMPKMQTSYESVRKVNEGVSERMRRIFKATLAICSTCNKCKNINSRWSDDLISCRGFPNPKGHVSSFSVADGGRFKAIVDGNGGKRSIRDTTFEPLQGTKLHPSEKLKAHSSNYFRHVKRIPQKRRGR